MNHYIEADRCEYCGRVFKRDERGIMEAAAVGECAYRPPGHDYVYFDGNGGLNNGILR